MNLFNRIALLAPWYQAQRHFGLGLNFSEFNSVCAQYEQTHRHYHTLRHIDSCMMVLERYYSGASEIPHITLAIFFHDIVYEIGNKLNEVSSAERFMTYANRVGIPRDDAAMIHDLIIMTESHQLPPSATTAHMIMNDVDMSILASDEETYLEYAKNIWLEYKSIGKEVYRDGRMTFLSTVDPSTVFHTAPMLSLVNRVQQNINKERDILENQPWLIMDDTPS